MHNQLDSYIKHYGGKAGTLQLLHDYYPKLRQYLAPTWIIPHGSNVTQKIYKALIDSRKSFGSPDILARASHPKDWFGLVDFLPTVRISDPERERSNNFLNNNYEEFKTVLNHHIEHSFSTRNEKYAKELHFALSPYIPHTLYTITEHPNQQDHFFVDTGTMGTFYGRNITDVIGEDIVCIEGHQDTKAIKKTLSLAQLLRKLKVFKQEDKLQYEIGIAKSSGDPYIFQVRKFADTFATLPKEIATNQSIMYQSRIMGTLPLDQVLYHYNGGNLDEIELAIDFADEENLVFSCILCSSHANFEQTPPNLKGFICEQQAGLFHNLTAPSQATLQNNGFVLLNTRTPVYDGYIKADISQQGIQRSKFNPKTQKHR